MKFWLLLSLLLSNLTRANNATFLPLRTDHVGPLEPSGLILFQGKFLTVNDKNDLGIYEVHTGKEFGEIRLFAKASIAEKDLKKKKFSLDFEGITGCHGSLFIVDERDRDIYQLTPPNFEMKLLDIKKSSYKTKISNVFSSGNEGFEGIACDEKNNYLYVVNERQFRRVFKISLSTLEVIDEFDLPTGNNLPRYEGIFEILPDFADAFFNKGFLYLLVRNDFKILKVDPNAKKIIAELPYNDFRKEEYGLENIPFGIAEGLYMDEKNIYLILDNNKLMRKNKKDNFPGLIKIQRPADF